MSFNSKNYLMERRSSDSDIHNKIKSTDCNLSLQNQNHSYLSTVENLNFIDNSSHFVAFKPIIEEQEVIDQITTRQTDIFPSVEDDGTLPKKITIIEPVKVENKTSENKTSCKTPELRRSISVNLDNLHSKSFDNLKDVVTYMKLLDAKLGGLQINVQAIRRNYVFLEDRISKLEGRPSLCSDNEDFGGDREFNYLYAKQKKYMSKTSKYTPVRISSGKKKTPLHHGVYSKKGSINQTSKIELSEFINKECKSSKLFSWTSLLVLVLVLAITSDIRRHSSFQESHVGKLLDKLGLTIHLEKLGKGFRIYMKLMYKWCQVNIPIYYSKGCDLAGPYLSLFLDRCNVIITVIYQTFVLLVNSITMYIPTLLKRIDAMMPGAAEAISNFGAKIIELLIYYWAIVCKTLSPLFLEVHNFLITRVLIGPLEPMVLYGHLTSAYKYALESTNLLYYSVIQMLQDD